MSLSSSLSSPPSYTSSIVSEDFCFEKDKQTTPYQDAIPSRFSRLKSSSGHRLASLLLGAAVCFLFMRLLQSYVELERVLRQSEGLWRDRGGRRTDNGTLGRTLNLTEGSSTHRGHRQALLSPSNSTSHNARCPDSETSDVLIIVLTSTTEVHSILPSLLKHGLRCVPHSSIEIYSDVEETITNPYPAKLHDSISLLLPQITSKNPEFSLRDILHHLSPRQLDTTTFRQHRHFSALQKWRLLPALIDSYHHHPNKSWFTIVNTETYLSWQNLLLWTAQLNASNPECRGGQLMLRSTEFGALQAGILLSRTAVATLAAYASRTAPEEPKQPDGGNVLASMAANGGPEATARSEKDAYRPSKGSSKAQQMAKRPTYLDKWYERLAKECCADVVLAMALAEVGIKLTRSFPILHGANPWQQDFAEGLWCHAPVTWGKMDVGTMETLSKIEWGIAAEVRRYSGPYFCSFVIDLCS